LPEADFQEADGMPRHAGKWFEGLLMLLLLTSTAAYTTRESDPARPRGPEARTAEPSPGKAAWRWTLEERIARRFDPEAMKARVAEERAEQRARQKLFPKTKNGPFSAGVEDNGSVMDTLNGGKHPELFFPDELFAHLLNDAFRPDDEYQSGSRLPVEERAAALGFGRDLWPRLEKTAAPLLKLEAERARRRAGPGDKDEVIRLCRVRAQALAAAKSEFGEEAFLRLLYEAVAPGMTREIIDRGLVVEDVDRMRYIAGGCK
jgi:hypothetical protein